MPRKKKETLSTFRGLDSEKDFGTPTRKEPSSPESETPEQLSLPGAEEAGAPPEPKISGNKCVAHFVRLRPDQDKDGERILHFEVSLQLSKEVAQILPAVFLDAWDTLSNDAAIKRLDLTTEEPMDWTLALAPDTNAGQIELDALVAQKVRVQSVEETGSTKARQVIRLSFSLPVPGNLDRVWWAFKHYGDVVWLAVAETNQRLPFNKGAER